jgi:hypothetical protein
MNQEALRARIRTRIHNRELPCQEEHQLFDGKGEGVLCDGCGELISSEQGQYNVVIVYTELGETTSFSMHAPCYQVWREECSHPTGVP